MRAVAIMSRGRLVVVIGRRSIVRVVGAGIVGEFPAAGHHPETRRGRGTQPDPGNQQHEQSRNRFPASPEFFQCGHNTENYRAIRGLLEPTHQTVDRVMGCVFGAGSEGSEI